MEQKKSPEIDPHTYITNWFDKSTTKGIQWAKDSPAKKKKKKKKKNNKKTKKKKPKGKKKIKPQKKKKKNTKTKKQPKKKKKKKKKKSLKQPHTDIHMGKKNLTPKSYHSTKLI